MSTSRRDRLILAIYPVRFRDRYGDELATVAADCGGGWQVSFDLVVSGIKARLYWLLIVVPAIRTRNGATLMPAVVPVAVGVLWLAGTGGLAVATNHIGPGNYRNMTAQAPHTAGGWALLAI